MIIYEDVFNFCTMVLMRTMIPSNDNFEKIILPVKPNPPTPMGMFKYANEMLDMWKNCLEENDLNESKKMRYQRQIIECDRLKIMALKMMTNYGAKPDQDVSP